MWGSKEKNCRKKKSYSNKEAVKESEFYYKNNKIRQSPYNCEVCGKWHLTGDKK